MKDLHRELTKVLVSLVDIEYGCEHKEGCVDCICKNHPILCDQFPVLIDIIQEVLHKES